MTISRSIDADLKEQSRDSAKMLNKFNILLPLIAFGSSAIAAETCEQYVGQTISPTTFDQVLATIHVPPPKGEFETTEAYEARSKGVNSTTPLIISKKIEDPKFLEYDADHQLFFVKSYLFDNSNFPAWEALNETGVPVDRYFNADLLISTSKTITGSYIAQNSFGSKTKVYKILINQKAIFDKNLSSYDEELFGKNKNIVGYFQMKPLDAELFKKYAKIAFVVTPKPPYLFEKTFPAGKATLTNPFEFQTKLDVIIADIQCALLTTGDDKVVGAYATQ